MTEYVDVAIPVGVRKTFAYSVPAALAGRVSPGKRVLVPFGRKMATGFVVGCSNERPEGDFRLRALREVIDNEPAIPPDLIETALWVADYYFTPPGEVLRALVPAGSLTAGERKVKLSERMQTLLAGGLRPAGLHAREELVLDTLARTGELSIEKLVAEPGLRDAGRWIEAMVERGMLESVDSVRRARVVEKSELAVRALPADPEVLARLTPLQHDLYIKLTAAARPVPVKTLAAQGSGPGVARALEKKGIVEIIPVKVDRIPFELAETPARKVLTFTRAQQQAFERLGELMRSSGRARCLLHGVTGSGKTEIYLRLIAEALESGNGAILLVPEIGLTPMLSRIASSHFPDRVALFHSGMSPGERLDQYARIRSGAARVVVGTRSAVFAPVKNLKLIVIDEEQDGSYKQDESPCYHARAVAWQRLQRPGGVLLMGSATPAIETYHGAVKEGTTLHLTLPERIEARPLPEVAIVDMSVEFQRHGRKTVISDRLRWEIDENLRRGEQSIVLLNRRGYARSLLCRSCGHVATCPDCSISLTYHQDDNRLICHYCALEQEVPSACGSCGGLYIYFVGVGTEQLEQIMRTHFPKARLARVDRDTTRRRGALARILFDFAARKLDILVGTQILAKGHDFPDVTLVGVVAADAGLMFPDFRAAERTFQLLTQVAGRAGRGRIPGRVVIQSFYPDHYALRFASRQDYAGFYQHEIEYRNLLGYPPYRGLVQVLITSKSEEKGLHIGNRVAEEIKLSALRHGARAGLQVLGPASAPLEKLRGQYRYQVLLKAAPGTGITPIMQDAFTELGRRKIPLKNVKVDVDPLSLL